MNDPNELLTQILTQKIQLEQNGITPKVILISEVAHQSIEQEWLETYKKIPWAKDFEKLEEDMKKVGLIAGILFGLILIKVNTVEAVEVR
jgi:hypothetical protein